MNVAMIGAHQDDEMFCLGTLLLCKQRGDKLTLITTTNGDKGMSDDPSIPYAEAAAIRDREMRSVADAMNADYTCLGEPDEALFDTWDNRLKLIEALRKHRVEMVFTHFTADYNVDHTTTSQMVYQTTMLSPIASIQTDSPPLPKAPTIFYMDPGPGYGFEATHFVEIPATVKDRMMELLSMHESQMAVARRSSGKDYRDDVLAKLKANGQRVGVEFAEAFRPCLASWRTPLTRFLP